MGNMRTPIGTTAIVRACASSRRVAFVLNVTIFRERPESVQPDGKFFTDLHEDSQKSELAVGCDL